MIRRRPRSTCTDTLLPDTTLFRSVNIVQSIIFAGMSGSAIADAAGRGRMMQHMLTRDGRYTPSYAAALTAVTARSAEHTSELQSLMRISSALFCLNLKQH